MFNLLKKDESKTLELLMDGIGGKENIDTLESCFTRVRVLVKNLDKINRDKIMEAGAKDLIISNEDYLQIVIGKDAKKIMDLLKEKYSI